MCTFRSSFFFFNDTATTEIYTLSLHDALPILVESMYAFTANEVVGKIAPRPLLLMHAAHDTVTPTEQSVDLFQHAGQPTDRKSTRLNSSHLVISYAVFCLKKKNKHNRIVLLLA